MADIVRAYKGRAVELKGTDTLTTALQIHSVEARNDDGAMEAYGGENASNGTFSVSTDASTQAFDEPLTAAQVIAAVQKYFIV